MKKRSTATIIIITLLIVGISIFGYINYLAPMYNNNISQTKIIDPEKVNTIAFGKFPSQGAIFGIEIEVTGNMSSIFDLEISNEEQIMHTAGIKNGEIDFIYKNDWYSDSCFIYVQPRKEKDGELEVSVRFLSIN